MEVEAMIRGVQKELGIGVDGRAGLQTWAAIYHRVTGKKPTPDASPSGGPPPRGGVDARSEKVIATLHPQVRPFARALILKAASIGINIKAISGLRTYAEQNALYAKGRTAPGPKVTNARGGFSNHNFGIAFDIGVFKGTKYVPESSSYKAVGALGVELGLEWGGNWTTIKDEPHFQLRPAWARNGSESEMLAQLRVRAESGRDFFA
jgi:peptidoglycan L-alanyl-D-glutamate endopeptidase CwlK